MSHNNPFQLGDDDYDLNTTYQPPEMGELGTVDAVVPSVAAPAAVPLAAATPAKPAAAVPAVQPAPVLQFAGMCPWRFGERRGNECSYWRVEAPQPPMLPWPCTNLQTPT